MAKRGLCLLLALAALFSLGVTAFAEEEPVTAEEPIATEEPVVTEEPVEEPEATEAPADEPVPAAESGECGEGVTWTLTDDGVLTISGNGAIKSNAFDARTDIKTLVITPGVTAVGWYAFFGCTSLTSVTIPGSVTEIGGQAFRKCTALTSVKIEEGVAKIEQSAFDDCTSLKSITIPASVTSFSFDVFEGCTSLTIKGYAFSAAHEYARNNGHGFTPLDPQTTKSGKSGNQSWNLTAAGRFTVTGSGAMADDPPWKECGYAIVEAVIGNGITSIGKNGFSSCRSLASVTIPASVTSIGEHAFSSCKSLSGITIPASVTSIGAYAFNYCDSLTVVNIPGTVASIGADAFAECDGLQRVSIGEGVRTIGSCAFKGCGMLSDVTGPWTLTSVGFDVFEGTPWRNAQKGGFITLGNCLVEYTGGGGAVTTPSGVTLIAENAFFGCHGVISVTIREGVEVIQTNAFWNCYNLEYVKLPATLKSIGDFAFSSCKKLKTVEGLGGDTVIGLSAFSNTSWAIQTNKDFYVVGGTLTHYNGEGAASVTVPDGIKAIGVHAFYGHSEVASVTLPGNVTTVERLAFENCPALTSVTVENAACDIAAYEATMGAPGTTVIRGYTGSTAEDYARRFGYKFVSLGQATELAAPTVTIAQTADGIKASWNKITGSPRYMVYYRENGGAWTKIGTTTDTVYTRAAKYLKAGVTYAFTVRCCANDKTTMLSGYKASNSVTYTVDLAAPTVTISKAADGIKVSWNKIDGAPRYMVYYKENGGSWTKIGTTTSTTYTRAAKYLKSGATYQFTVRCCANDKKTMLGPYKASNSLTYTATTQLAAPTVKIEKVSTGIKVSWNKVTGSPRYMVYYKEGNGGWVKIGTTTATSYTRAAKYLKNNVTYQFTVRCCENDKKTLLGPYKASNSLKYTK